MEKRKIFVKTELSNSWGRNTQHSDTLAAAASETIPPTNTVIRFVRNAKKCRSFNFSPWYGLGIDEITHAFQEQIERFLNKQDADVEVSTVTGYCSQGVRQFLDYAALLSATRRRSLGLADVGRECIDGYLRYLGGMGTTRISQRTSYSYTKSILHALGRRGLLNVVNCGDDATFPKNPFPNLSRDSLGEKPFTVAERRSFTAAIRTAVRPLFTHGIEPTSELLAYALLIVALHTGRNATPLLEMRTDCLRAHPKDHTLFLMLYKRRGYTTSNVALRANSTVERAKEFAPSVRPTVGQLIKRVIELTQPLRQHAPSDICHRVWLFRSRKRNSPKDIRGLSIGTVAEAVTKLVRDYQLQGSDGKPMRINVSRLRKTFVNRIHEILDGDTATTAAAAGNSPHVIAQHYLRPPLEAQRKWRFMGSTLVDELLTNTLGATERTPVGRCSDSKSGEYAPKRAGDACQSFLNCLRCRNYVVTGDDLWRLYSFYWRVLRERSRVEKRRWELHLSHIPRLIERDVIEPGLARKIFTQAEVNAARERGRSAPHPFWASPTVIADLATLA